MAPYFAVTFQQDSDGYATGYSVHSYHNFLIDMRQKGFKPHLSGMRSMLEAEIEGNRLSGTAVVETVPPAQAAIRKRWAKPTKATSLTSLADAGKSATLTGDDADAYGDEVEVGADKTALA